MARHDARRSRLWVVLTASALLGACEPGPTNDDSYARPRSTPRAISLSPIATEVLVGIGATDSLIGVDSASARLDELGTLPVVDLASAIDFDVDLVIVPRLAAPEPGVLSALRARGVEVVEFAPHDFDDAFALCRRLGARFGRSPETHVFVRSRSLALARISASSRGLPRPRVAAVVGLDPLEVAGGHSFTTDLIEIAGAESVTHGGEARRVAMTEEQLRATRPDLIIVTSPSPMPERERARARRACPDATPIEFVAFDPETLWLRGAEETASTLRRLVRELTVTPARRAAP